MADSLVILHVDDGVASITLNDPGRRNALSPAMSTSLAEVCADVALREDVRAVTLTGAGSVFSAGGDLASLSDPGRSLPDAYAGLTALANLVVPVVAAVNGPVVGAGMNLFLACDLAVCSRGSRFQAPFLDIGIHPGGAFLWRLIQLAGRQAAAALVLFGETVDADRARDLGLVWEVVDDDALLDTVRRLAARAASYSGPLVRRAKSNLRTSVALTHSGVAEQLELAAQTWSMEQPAFADGVERLRQRLLARGSA